MVITIFEKYWNEALIELIENNFISKVIQKTLFDNVKYCTSTGTSIILTSPSEIHRDQIVSRYGLLLEYILYKKSGHRLRVDIEVISDPISFDHKLKEEYSFDNFVFGENNEFAMNAAKAITKNPGKEYNPCVMYGGPGTGKTHLLHAIGNEISRIKPELKVLYTPSESFINEFIEAIRSNNVNNFKNKYRSIDVLLMDNVHDLERKNATQKELFYTFKHLISLNKQIVVVSERRITELVFFSEDLLKTLESGIEIEILPPDYDERIAILDNMVTERDIDIPEYVLQIVAREIKDDISKIKSAIKKMVAYRDLTGKDITLEYVKTQIIF